MLALAWTYTKLAIDGTWFGALFFGVQAAVLAVILRAVHRIGEHILTDPWLWSVAILSAAASAAGVSFWMALPTAGAVYALAAERRYLLAGLAIATATVLAILTSACTEGPLASSILVADVPPTTFALFLARRLTKVRPLEVACLASNTSHSSEAFPQSDTRSTRARDCKG